MSGFRRSGHKCWIHVYILEFSRVTHHNDLHQQDDHHNDDIGLYKNIRYTVCSLLLNIVCICIRVSILIHYTFFVLVLIYTTHLSCILMRLGDYY